MRWLGDGTTGLGPLDTAAVWAGAIIAVLGLLAGAWRVVRRVLCVLRRVDQVVDDWQGTPPRPGVPARAGVMQRLATIEQTMGIVAHEVRPNGGSSLRDAVHRVDRRTASIVGDEEPPPPRGRRESGDDPT